MAHLESSAHWQGGLICTGWHPIERTHMSKHDLDEATIIEAMPMYPLRTWPRLDVYTPPRRYRPRIDPLGPPAKNRPCPCGSGHKYKKCCMNKKQP